MQPDLKQDKRIDSCSHIVHHNSSSARKSFQASKRKWLSDIEPTKEYKTGQKVFPIERNGNESDHLSCHFINNNKSGIIVSALSGHYRGRRNTQQRNDCRSDYFDWDQPPLRDQMRCSPPAQDSDCRRVCARTRTEITNTKKGGDEP